LFWVASKAIVAVPFDVGKNAVDLCGCASADAVAGDATTAAQVTMNANDFFSDMSGLSLPRNPGHRVA